MHNVDRLFRPASLAEALEILKAHPDAVPIAGGTDVLVKMRKNSPEHVLLLAVNTIRDEILYGVREDADGTIRIGAATTFTALAKSEIIEKKLPMLQTAALAMGGPQIQNVATLGGNICNGAVSADSAPSLFALDAKLVLRTADATRVIPIPEFYLGPGRVDRKPGELLVEILIPPRGAHFGCVYHKFATRKAMDLAILGVAAAVAVEEDLRIAQASIALGVAAPVPVRCEAAEAFLIGKTPDEAVLAKAGELALESAKPRDSWRASKRYREALIRTLSGRAVREAYDAAAGFPTQSGGDKA